MYDTWMYVFGLKQTLCDKNTQLFFSKSTPHNICYSTASCVSKKIHCSDSNLIPNQYVLQNLLLNTWREG